MQTPRQERVYVENPMVLKIPRTLCIAQAPHDTTGTCQNFQGSQN